MVATEPLAGNCTVVLDATGIGAALRDIFEAADFNLVSISITGGDQPVDHGGGRWSVPKADLAGCVEAALHSGSLKFAPALGEAQAMAAELQNFRRIVTGAGRATYGAKSGKHDDLVLSVSYALWLASRPVFKRRVLKVV